MFLPTNLDLHHGLLGMFPLAWVCEKVGHDLRKLERAYLFLVDKTAFLIGANLRFNLFVE